MSPLSDSITDVTGIRVGHWTDRHACTGCTVVLCGNGAVAGVDVRGAAPGTRETDQQAAAVLRVRAGLGEAARGQAVDHALDGGDIHRGEAAELVLRARAGFGEFCQRRPLRRRQIDADLARENGGVALPDLAQDKTDLLLQYVGRPRRLWAALSTPRAPCDAIVMARLVCLAFSWRATSLGMSSL